MRFKLEQTKFIFFKTVCLLLLAQSVWANFLSKDELKKLPASIQKWYTYETQYLSRDLKPGVFAPIHENSQNPSYTPDQANIFLLKGYWLPEAVMKIVESDLPINLRRIFFRTHNQRREVLLVVHPESETFYSHLTLQNKDFELFNAAATASSRSLLVWQTGKEQEPFIIKVSLDATIAGTDRTISRQETVTSVGMNQILGQIDNLPKGFKYLSEPLGIIPNGMARGGMIVRTFPKLKNSSHALIPYFSLYAQPTPNTVPLVVQMIQHSKKPPRAFILDNIIKPFVDHWLALAIDNGIVTEPHGQNILLEVNDKNMPTGVTYHRDFGGFNADLVFVSHRYGVATSQLPTSTGDRINDYYQTDHFENIKISLETYFADGVLYNIESKWQDWIARGWIQEDTAKDFEIKRLMIEYVEELLSKRFGHHVQLEQNLSNLANLVKSLQAKTNIKSCETVF